MALEDILDGRATLSRPDLDFKIQARDHAEQRAELYSNAAVLDGRYGLLLCAGNAGQV